MLGGMALLWRWRARRPPRARRTAPNLVMGANVQVCWDKFCRYWQVEPRLVPMEPGRLHLTGPRRRPGATRTPSAWWRCSARPWTAATSRSGRSATDWTGCRPDRARRADPRRRRLRRVRRAVPAAGPGVGLPGPAGGLDQRLGAQVRPGLPGRRLGRVAGRRRAARGPGLQGELPRRGDADLRAELLPARQPGRGAVLQLPAARLRGLPAGAAGLPGRGHVPGGADRRDGAVRAALRRQRPAGAGLPAARPAGRRLHGLRRVRAAAAARLAGARLHLPREPAGHGGAADRGAQRLQHRPGRRAARRPAHAGRGAAASPRRRSRCSRPDQRPPTPRTARARGRPTGAAGLRRTSGGGQAPLRSRSRASARMAAPSVSLRRSFTYARWVLYGSACGGAGGFASSWPAGKPQRGQSHVSGIPPRRWRSSARSRARCSTRTRPAPAARPRRAPPRPSVRRRPGCRGWRCHYSLLTPCFHDQP